MAHQGTTEFEGEILEMPFSGMYKVQLVDGRIVLCTVAGKMKMNRIRVYPGDKVRVEMTPYDDTKGRITYRIKS